MVATDVASRGIGMIDRCTTFPSPPSFAFVAVVCGLIYIALFSTITRSSSDILGQTHHCSLWIYILENLGCQMQRSPLHFFTPSRHVPIGYRGGMDSS